MKTSTKLVLISCVPIMITIITLCVVLLPTEYLIRQRAVENQLKEANQFYSTFIREGLPLMPRDNLFHLVRSSRFGINGQGYAFILDKRSMVLVHPTLKFLEGKVANEVKDYRNMHLAALFIERAAGVNHGFAYYKWKHEHTSTIETKYSYSKSISDDLILVTTLPVDHITRSLKYNLLVTVSLVLILIAGGLCCYQFCIRPIISDLTRMIGKLKTLTPVDDESDHRFKTEIEEICYYIAKFLRYVFELLYNAVYSNKDMQLYADQLKQIAVDLDKTLAKSDDTQIAQSAIMSFINKLQSMYSMMDIKAVKLASVLEKSRQLTHGVGSMLSDSLNPEDYYFIKKQMVGLESSIAAMLDEQIDLKSIRINIADVTNKLQLVLNDASLDSGRDEQDQIVFSIVAGEVLKVTDLGPVDLTEDLKVLVKVGEHAVRVLEEFAFVGNLLEKSEDVFNDVIQQFQIDGERITNKRSNEELVKIAMMTETLLDLNNEFGSIRDRVHRANKDLKMTVAKHTIKKGLRP